MIKGITKEELKVDLDTTHELVLVEVLPPKNFEEFHLPNALNIPLARGFERHVEKMIPDKHKGVVLYCKNVNCGASQMAAKRLEKLGYESIFTYPGGKEDWKNSGSPTMH
jgi:rhodanese-related sulfurtransferase